MKVIIKNLDQFNEYYAGVVVRSKHHADEVDIVIKHLRDVLLSVNPEYMAIYHRNDDIKNVIWFKINGNMYVLSYRHTKNISLINKNLKGMVICTFDNSDSFEDVKKVFDKL